ncbi:MAG: hydrogenase maturation protease [Chthoniobacterales bacterium]|nr:hydrogenase maturation protease [Chthoniobacterales bacterium]
MKRILVAGIGNIFFRDDAFGCEVVSQLARRPLPEGVSVKDFGIRSYDLAYAMMDGYDATILVDATAQGAEPGTIYLIEPDIKKLDELENEAVNAHSMNPVRVLQLVRSLGGNTGWLRVVGCEPALLESEDGAMGLSEKVQAAVLPAIEMIESLIRDILDESENASAPNNLQCNTIS